MRTSTFRRMLTRALVIAVIAAFSTACNKEEPTKAVIIVKNADGSTVPDVHVKLFANAPLPVGDQSRLTKEGYTGGDGRVTFEYSEFYEQGQSGFAVLDILCTKDSLIGEGIIKILEEETTEETVFLEAQ